MKYICSEDPLMPGNSLTLTDLNKVDSIQATVIEHHGSFLLLELEKDVFASELLNVCLFAANKPVEFTSQVCFRISNKRVCIKLPPAYEKKERRKYLRLPVELPMSYETGSELINTSTINISAGGAYFFTPQRLVVGQLVGLNICIRDEEIKLAARVIRTMLNAASVEFIEDQETINTLVSYIYSNYL